MVCWVDPFDHIYELATGEVKVTDWLLQKVVGPDAIIAADDDEFPIDSVWVEEAEHPLMSVAVSDTVYVLGE